jgi:hypothetical protein
MKLNTEVIKSIATETPTAVNLFENFAGRQRHRQETNIGRYRMALIREGVKIADEEYIEVWKKLQDAGVGTLIIGRHGNPDRFKWNYSVKDVGRIAKGEEVSTKTEKEEKKTKKQRVKSDDKSKPEKILYVAITPNKAIKIDLPENFSEEEADLLANVLKNLAKTA